MGKLEFSCVVKFAQFCAELTRQGIALKAMKRQPVLLSLSQDTKMIVTESNYTEFLLAHIKG